jgi:hypothetical protein
MEALFIGMVEYGTIRIEGGYFLHHVKLYLA